MHYLYVASLLYLSMIYLPQTTNTSFRSNIFLMIFFFIQMAYVILSAKQISHGYPNEDTNIANMIEKNYSLLNRILFLVKIEWFVWYRPIATFPSCLSSTRFSIGPSQIRLWISFTGLRCTVLMLSCMMLNVEYTLKGLMIQSDFYNKRKREREKKKRLGIEKICLGGFLLILLTVFVTKIIKCSLCWFSRFCCSHLSLLHWPQSL